MSVGIIFLAAGKSERFGRNKLVEPFMGKTILEHTLLAFPKESLKNAVAVVSWQETASIFTAFGVETVFNDIYNEGINTSIKKGLEAAEEMLNEPDGYMFSVCDCPFRNEQTIIKMINAFEANKEKIIVLSYGNERGNPVIFPKSFKATLMGLGRNKGGGSLLKDNEDIIIEIQASSRAELLDIDSQDDLKTKTVGASPPPPPQGGQCPP